VGHTERAAHPPSWGTSEKGVDLQAKEHTQIMGSRTEKGVGAGGYAPAISRSGKSKKGGYGRLKGCRVEIVEKAW